MHRQSPVPCKPSEGWLADEIRPCSRLFIACRDEDEESEMSACLDITMARFLECVMEERPNHALRVLNEGIQQFIQMWDDGDGSAMDDQVSP